MQMKKKLLSVFIAGAMTVSLTSGFASADTTTATDTVKLVSNLQNAPFAAIPVPKAQLAWLAAGSGNNAENYAHVAWEDATNKKLFSYQFENESGTIKGRVQGDNGTITVQALGVNGRYVTVPLADDATDAMRNNVPNATEVYNFAMQFVQHFGTITANGHDHSNHTTHQLATNSTSAERFPVVPLEGDAGTADNRGPGHIAYAGNNADAQSIVFVYARHDLGGMMSGMVFNREVKLVSNLQNTLFTDTDPAANRPAPAPKTQLAWIGRGAGNTETNFAHANWELTNVNQFSYEFSNESGTVKGRVQGIDGEITVQALGVNGRYVTVPFAADATDAARANVPNATEVYNFAMQFARHFATITANGHDHSNHTNHLLVTNETSAERFPIRLLGTNFGTTAEPGPHHVSQSDNRHQTIVFVFNRSDLANEAGMMSGMVLGAGFTVGGTATPPGNDTNPSTGVTLVIVPMAIAGLAMLVSKKRR
jgi:hypothetical protein